jgi:hypothetical protein
MPLHVVTSAEINIPYEAPNRLSYASLELAVAWRFFHPFATEDSSVHVHSTRLEFLVCLALVLHGEIAPIRYICDTTSDRSSIKLK